MYTSVSAKDVFKRLPCAFSNDLDSEAMKSAPSSKASGGQTYAWSSKSVRCAECEYHRPYLYRHMLEALYQVFVLEVCILGYLTRCNGPEFD